jgi:hypothetical protein
VTVQAATTVGVMKTQTLCFRPIGKKLSFNTLSPKLEEGTCLSFQYLLAAMKLDLLSSATVVDRVVKYQNGMVAIHPRHNKLLISLRTAVENGEGSLDKEATSHDDLFDAFRMSLQFWH